MLCCQINHMGNWASAQRNYIQGGTTHLFTVSTNETDISVHTDTNLLYRRIHMYCMSIPFLACTHTKTFILGVYVSLGSIYH